VSDIVSANRADIKSVPDVSETKGGAFLSGLLNIDDAVVGLIDLDSILETEAEAA
jgi:chemotaxis signal transduction protein